MDQRRLENGLCYVKGNEGRGIIYLPNFYASEGEEYEQDSVAKPSQAFQSLLCYE